LTHVIVVILHGWQVRWTNSGFHAPAWEPIPSDLIPRQMGFFNI